MIALQLPDGTFLDLNPDTVIDLELVNPIFSDGDIIEGSFSLPITLPGGEDSPKNAAALDHPDVVESVGVKTLIKGVRLWFDGNIYKTGNLRVNKSGANDQYECNFIFGLSTLGNDIKKKKLTEICDEAVVMASGVYAKRVIIMARTNFHSGTFTLIVNGREYSGTSNSALVTAINADVTEPRALAVFVDDDIYPDADDYFTLEPFADAGDLTTPLSITISGADDPSLYVRWRIIDAEFVEDYNDDIKTFLDAYNTATPADDRMRFAMLHNRLLYDDATLKKRYGFQDFNLINNNKGGYFLNKPVLMDSGSNTRFEPDNRTSVAPFITLKWVMEKIAAHFDAAYEGDWLESEEYNSAIFYHSNTLDLKVRWLGTKDYLATRRSFNCNEFLPEWEVNEFFKALKKRFNLAIYLNEATGKLRFRKREPIILATAYTDITSKSSVKRELELNPATGIQLSAAQDSSDELAILDEYNQGEPSIPIDTNISGLTIKKNFLPGGEGTGILNIPFSERKLSNRIPVVFMFYHYETEGVGADYATANINLADCDFKFQGESGLALVRWPAYIRFLLTRKIIMLDQDFSYRELQAIDWERKYRFDRSNFLYKKIKVKLSMNDIKISSAEMYSV